MLIQSIVDLASIPELRIPAAMLVAAVILFFLMRCAQSKYRTSW